MSIIDELHVVGRTLGYLVYQTFEKSKSSCSHIQIVYSPTVMDSFPIPFRIYGCLLLPLEILNAPLFAAEYSPKEEDSTANAI